MLTLHPAPRGPRPDRLPGETVWIDLLDPTPEERAYVERGAGVRLPTRAELSEIESSSRIHAEHGVLYMSTPTVLRSAAGEPGASPLGFVLSPQRLVTIRFAELPAVATYAAQCENEEPPRSSIAAFIGLTEAIVDRMADVLEQIGAQLDELSAAVFHGNDALPSAPARADAALRAALRTVGRAGDHVSKIRDTLLGIGRIVPFVAETAGWIPAESKTRLNTLRQDIVSLNDYDAHLSNKIQFLLDATLGFINIEQNTIIKTLTVVSVVGIPPTLVASIYGMNFKIMPELNWAFGYPYGLGLILLSAIAPLVWFRLRGWL
jgi:magnesium transporter